MARTRTFTAIIAEAATRADHPVPTTTTFVTAAEALVVASQAYAELHEKLVTADPTRVMDSETFSVTDATVREYALPSDYHSTIRLDFERGSERYKLERCQITDLSEGNLSSNFGFYGFLGARFAIFYSGIDGTAGRIVFDRNPSVGTYRHWYVTAPAEVTSAATTLDGVGGWEDWITLTLAIHMKDKAEEDTSVLQAERARIEARIEIMAANRDAGRPVQITNTRDRGPWGPWPR